MENEKEVAIPPSCAELAAQLIVQGCLPMIAGTVKGATPIQPRQLSQEERERLGLRGEGATLFYPAGQTGVFFDAAGSESSVWFAGEDSDKATATLHNMLLRSFPQTRQLDDVPHATNPQMRARAYQVDLGQGRLAGISTSFKNLPNGVLFRARVIAQKRK